MGKDTQKTKRKPKCEHLDCFACDSGECTALDKAFLLDCPFYKTRPDHRRGVRKSFYRLIAKNRLDLILRYWGDAADFGPFIKDVGTSGQTDFDDGQYRERIREMAGEGLSDCPACDRKDCFAEIDGYCIILEEKLEKCPFYQTASSWNCRMKKSFCQITSRARFDLISTYRETLRSFGLFQANLDRAWKQHDELEKYRQKTLGILCQADDPEECAEALKPEEVDFMPLYKQPKEKKVPLPSEESVDSDGQTTFDPENTSVLEDTETEDREQHDGGSFERIPEDRHEADTQLQGIIELINSREKDSAVEEKEITEINAAGEGFNSMQESRDELDRLHEENRFAKDNAGTVFRIEDFYKPTLLRSQAPKRRPDDDWTFGILGAEILLLAAKDYVHDLRRQFLYPGNMDNMIRILYFENYFGSKDYWLLTNLNPEKVKQRCVELAMNQEKAAILDDNERIAISRREQDKSE